MTLTEQRYQNRAFRLDRNFKAWLKLKFVTRKDISFSLPREKDPTDCYTHKMCAIVSNSEYSKSSSLYMLLDMQTTPAVHVLPIFFYSKAVSF